MIRRAFRMAVHPGQEAEYERRHRPIRPERQSAPLREVFHLEHEVR